MKKIIILLLGCCTFFACSQSGSENTESTVADAPSETLAQPAEKESDEREVPASATAAKKGEKIDFDFLTDCDALEVWQGSIQGLPASESPGVFIMAQCAENRDYDLIVYSKRNIELGEATDAKTGNIKSGLSGATYYAFEILKKEAANPENDMDTFDYVFPSEVKVYKLLEDGWYLIDSQRVSSFEELGSLKLKTIRQEQTGNPNI